MVRCTRSTPRGRVHAVDDAGRRCKTRPPAAPWFLPDGRSMLFPRAYAGSGSNQLLHVALWMWQVPTPVGRIRVRRGLRLRASPVRRAGALMAQPFDAASLRTTGDPFMVNPEVSVDSHRPRGAQRLVCGRPSPMRAAPRSQLTPDRNRSRRRAAWSRRRTRRALQCQSESGTIDGWSYRSPHDYRSTATSG